MEESAPVINYILSFLLVGIAWGGTTPFIRKAAQTHNPAPHPVLESQAVKSSFWKPKVYGAFFGVVDLLRNPRYAFPLILNLTGSIWFFLLIGQAGKLDIRVVCIITNTSVPYRAELDCPYCEYHGIPIHCLG